MRLEVKYLGDQACIRCHAEIAQPTDGTPWAVPSLRSRRPREERATKPGRPLFKAQGFEYAIENRNGHVIHTETRRDASAA